MPVTLSIPSNPELQTNKYSTMFGAGITLKVQYKHINIHTNQPRNPQTLLEETPDLD